MAAGAAVIRVAAQLRRGRALRLHTGHEMQGTVGLVHMNGRLYDPTLGRFLSADPFIQAPAAPLSYHRYAYVMNNPLVLTDPSGYSWLSKTWKKLWRNEVFRVGLAIGIGMATGGWAAGVYENYAAAMILEGATPVAIGGSVSLTSGVIAGASGGFAGTLVATGGDVKAAAQSGLTGGIFGGVGVAFDGGGFANYAGHGVAGCVSAALGGGDCARGAVAQVFSKFVTVETRGMGLDRYTRSVIATVAGGAASVMTGGKFSDGARTAAMGYLFNEAKSQSEVNQSGEGVGEVSNASKAEMGVALRVQEIESMGGTVLGRNVTLVTQSGVEFQSDVVWRDRFGGFHFDEVKFGPETKLTVPQRNGLTEAIEGKFTVTGENAVRAGLTPGAPRGGLPANRIMGFELRVFGGPYFGFGERAARQWERMMRSMKVGGPD